MFTTNQEGIWGKHCLFWYKMSIKPTPVVPTLPLDLPRSSPKNTTNQPTDPFQRTVPPWEGRFEGHHLPTKSRRSVDPPAISGLQRSDTAPKKFLKGVSLEWGRDFLWTFFRCGNCDLVLFLLGIQIETFNIFNLILLFVSSKVSIWIYQALHRASTTNKQNVNESTAQ